MYILYISQFLSLKYYFTYVRSHNYDERSYIKKIIIHGAWIHHIEKKSDITRVYVHYIYICIYIGNNICKKLIQHYEWSSLKCVNHKHIYY